MHDDHTYEEDEFSILINFIQQVDCIYDQLYNIQRYINYMTNFEPEKIINQPNSLSDFKKVLPELHTLIEKLGNKSNNEE